MSYYDLNIGQYLQILFATQYISSTVCASAQEGLIDLDAIVATNF